MGNSAAYEVSDALEGVEVAAVEDGRSPVNRFQAACLSYFWSFLGPCFSSKLHGFCGLLAGRLAAQYPIPPWQVLVLMNGPTVALLMLCRRPAGPT